MKIDVVRPQTYRLLALGFRYPTRESIGELSGDEASLLLSQIAALLPVPGLPGARHLEALAEEVRNGDPVAMARAASHEYCRLFVGPTELPCAPYGSVYLDGGQVMGPSSVDCVSSYEREGLTAAPETRGPPDHIALELEFMACLSERYALSLDSDPDESRRLLRAQVDFLTRHVGLWGPAFAERVDAAASCHLYRFLAEMLPAWLAFDRELLDLLEATARGEGAVPCA